MALTRILGSFKDAILAGGTESAFSGSVASTGSFGSIYTDKNVNASSFVGDGSALTGIDIPTAAAISGSVVSGVSGSSVSTGSFGRVEVAGDLSVTGAGQGWVKLATATAGDETPIVIGSSALFSSTYNKYQIIGTNITNGDNVGGGTSFYCQYQMGGATLSGAADYEWRDWMRLSSEATLQSAGDSSDSTICVCHNVAGDTGENLNFTVTFYAPSATNNHKYILYRCAADNDTPYVSETIGIGRYQGSSPTAALTAISFYFDGINVVTGTFELYGLTK